MNRLQETEVLLEISLAIGQSLELDKMLKHGVNTLVRTLNAQGCLVLQHAPDEQGALRWATRYSVPSRLSQQPFHQEAMAQWPLPLGAEQLPAWHARLPLVADSGERHHYAFALPHFGVLVLHRKAPPLSHAMLLSLQKLMDKLAASARACLYDHELKKQVAAAREASLAKDQFLANMSHEIRSPMNGVLGMLNIVLETPLEKEQQEYLNLARISAEHLLEIINQILDISKIEANKLDLQVEDLDLFDFVGNIIKTQAPRAYSKHLRLLYQIARDVPRYVRTDPLRLQQILNNLLGNALKFTDSGSVSLQVNLMAAPPQQACSMSSAESSDAGGPLDPPGAWLEFLVTDTGIGIPSSELERIFEAFEQVDNGSTRRFEGTGLGLAITRQLAELLGGTIDAESRYGHGTRMSVLLPVPLAPPRPAAPRRLDAVDPAACRILFVESEPMDRDVFCAMMRALGAPYEVCASGPEALFRLRTEREDGAHYDLILIDAGLPGMDGYSVAQRIIHSGLATAGEIRIVTSSALAGDSRRCREMGLAGYVTKPLTLADFRQLMREHWKGVARGQPSARPSQPTEPRRLNILLAEDNSINQALALKLLEKLQARCDVAANGREAVRLAGERHYDLILMDMMMPVMDGLQATQAIRERELTEARRRTPIIALTANAMKGDRERYLAADIQGYVAKPIDATLLYGEIASVMNGQGPAAAAEQDDVPEDDALMELDEQLALAGLTPPDLASTALDWEAALAQLGDDESLMRPVLDMFSAELPGYCLALEAALERQNLTHMEEVAHTLKGLTATFCAERARQAAERLEQACRQGCAIDLLREQQRALLDELAILLDEMKRLQRQLNA